MTSKCSKLNETSSSRRVQTIENCCGFFLLITLTVFDVHFRWSFSENLARKKEKNKLRHHHVISMICTLIEQLAVDQSAREKSLSYCKFRFFSGMAISAATLANRLLFSWSWSVAKVGYNLGRTKKERKKKKKKARDKRHHVLTSDLGLNNFYH